MTTPAGKWHCEAVTRPNMRFVPLKDEHQQATLCLHRTRQGFVEERTATYNRVRGLLSEFGVALPLSPERLRREIVPHLDGLAGWVKQCMSDLLEHAGNIEDRLSAHASSQYRQVDEAQIVRNKTTFFGQFLDQCPKKIYKYRTGEVMSELKSHISALIEAAEPGHVWVPTDFAPLGSRDAIDKTLQRMVRAGELRRIDRGLYDRPKLNRLTKRPTTPDYRAVVEAIARRDQLRLLVDGMTAANDLGLTDAVPARVTIHTDTRRRAVQLDKLTIEFKQTAPSRLYWAGRPAMRIVQALHWLKDTLSSERSLILRKLSKVLADPVHGAAIRQDLLDGFNVLPAWMQSVVRQLPGCDPQAASTATRQSPGAEKPPSVRRRAAKRVEAH